MALRRMLVHPLRTYLRILFTLALTPIAPVPSSAQDVSLFQYWDDFFSDTYKDAAATTADWNTFLGELRLWTLPLAGGGTYNTPGYSDGLDFDGRYAYLADWTNGFIIADVSNPASPTLVGSFNTSGTAFSVAVDGDYAYVGDGAGGLKVIDISNPASPTLAGSLALSGTTYGVAVDGDYAVVARQQSTFPQFIGITVVDVSDPTNPGILGSVDTPGGAWRLDIEGDYVYIADGSGLRVASIANPASPSIVGSYSTTGQTHDIAVDGNIAYVADDSGMLLVLNVASPSSPSLITSVSTAGPALGVSVDGDYVYVAEGQAGIEEFEVTTPSSPVLVGSHSTSGSAWEIEVRGKTACIADDYGGLYVLQVAYHRDIALVASYAASGAMGDIVVEGNYAFAADGASGVCVFDVTNPEAPYLAATYDTPGLANGLAVTGNYLVVADGSAGIEMLDISTPTSPSLAGSITPGHTAWDVAVAGNYAYVANGGTVEVIDISNPTAPSVAGSASASSSAYGIAVRGNYAFVAENTSGLVVLDISDPTNPTPSGGYNTSGYAYDVAIMGDYAYVANGTAFITLNISNPTSPMYIPALPGPTLQWAWRVAVSGNYLFLTDRYSTSVLDYGFHVYVILVDTGQPSHTDFYHTTGDPSGVFVAGDYAFVTVRPYAYSLDNGLRVFRSFGRGFDVTRDTGQSSSIYAFGGDIIAMKLNATQTGDISWKISNSNGASWTAVPGLNTWMPMPGSGSNVKWQSTHYYHHDGVNPAVSFLTIDWRFDKPWIDVVADVPGDQGKQAQVSWRRSGYDISGGTWTITEYVIYRQSESSWTTWDSVGVAYATSSDQYSLAAPTMIDSTVFNGIHFTKFFIRAKTTNPLVYFDSPVDSGYSIDNLAPATPTNITVQYNTGYGNIITWTASPDPDMFYYELHRSSDQGFQPDSTTLFSTTKGTSRVDHDYDGWQIYYKVVAVDSSGNKSVPGVPSTLTGVDDSGPPRAWALHQNFPNPFKSFTQILYDVASDGANVEIAIFDVRGRRVRTLVSGPRSAGRLEAVWNGKDQNGRCLSSGVYFYRLRADGAEQVRKMSLLK